jgi:hypothetical protein
MREKRKLPQADPPVQKKMFLRHETSRAAEEQRTGKRTISLPKLTIQSDVSLDDD